MNYGIYDCPPGHPCCWNFYCTVPVVVARVKSCVNCSFDPASVRMRITSNKLYFIPKREVSSVVGVLLKSGGFRARPQHPGLRSWKTWKIMEFFNIIFQALKVKEFEYGSWKMTKRIFPRTTF